MFVIFSLLFSPLFSFQISGVYFLCYSVGFCWFSVASVVLVSEYHIGKRSFPCGSGVFSGGSAIPIGVRMFCYLDLEQSSPQEQGVKQQDAFFSIKGKMRLPFANGTRGFAKLAHFVATDKLRKERSAAPKHYKNSGFGGNWRVQI